VAQPLCFFGVEVEAVQAISLFARRSLLTVGLAASYLILEMVNLYLQIEKPNSDNLID
jgi:hypothetical protein